jgi:beta-mannosidase
MPERVKSIAGHRRHYLTSGWQICSTAPDACAGPDDLSKKSLAWLPGHAPSTAAACLRALGTWSLDHSARRFDSEDWWYRVRFTAPPLAAHEEVVLGFDGLATVADAWLNGTPLLSSDNMFLAHERILQVPLPRENELVIRFRALDHLLEAKRPRPKWRAPMVENQQLRWFRTTLLGRTPGWSPPAAAVGPWRSVWLETRAHVRLSDVKLRTGVDGRAGWIEVFGSIAPLVPHDAVKGTALVLTRRGEPRRSIPLRNLGNNSYGGRLEIPNVALWWPHTHGEPCLYDARLAIRLAQSNTAPANTLHSDATHSNTEIDVDLGHVGFRTIALDSDEGDFSLRINGVPIFCRGACWTPPDPVSLDTSLVDPSANSTGTPLDSLRQTLDQVRAAGMNMLRVGGTMVYESNAFLDLCDVNGILLWQDFMFANMSYPQEDTAFTASVTAEARQQLARLAGRPCLAVLCGNSEGEQQAAMWGAPRESWSPALFHETLARLAREYRPDVPYWPSSAHGGSFPHQGNSGTASYYGVGAYMRPLEDARRAEIRFATECLAFANIPEDRTLAKMPGGPSIRCHHPAWKSRTPRDMGAGWDFDDVRDHYLTRLFGVNPLELRYADHDRYLALSRIVSGEVMASTLAEWRRKRSTCRGGLIWFWRDLWCGAGWGVVDALGTPKAAYHYIRRVCQPVALSMSDEGGNGLYLHLVNERPKPLTAILTLKLYRGGEINVGSASRALTLQARESAEIAASSLFEGFLDLSYAYRFGPPQHELAVATLIDENNIVLAQAFHFPTGLWAARELDVGLTATATPMSTTAAAGTPPAFELTITARRFAQSVWIEADGFVPDDSYFHLAPCAARTITLRGAPGDSGKPPSGRVHALNAQTTARIEFRG